MIRDGFILFGMVIALHQSPRRWQTLLYALATFVGIMLLGVSIAALFRPEPRLMGRVAADAAMIGMTLVAIAHSRRPKPEAPPAGSAAPVPSGE
jgi:hypothetical protein